MNALQFTGNVERLPDSTDLIGVPPQVGRADQENGGAYQQKEQRRNYYGENGWTSEFLRAGDGRQHSL